MLKWVTAERTSSTLQSDGVIHERQLAAYYKAREFAKDKSVLEIGCGEGSGTEILAEQAGELVAIDYSEKAIKTASARLLSSGVRFQVEQVPPINAADGRFDVVIIFQMIEHLEDPGPLIEEILRVLKKGGALLLSTVNKEESISNNPFHPHEFDREDLEAVLKKYFAQVEIFGLYGDEKHDQYLEKNKNRVSGIMKLDIFDLSSRLPNGLRKILYSVANRVMRISLRYGNKELCDGITHENFFFKKDESLGCLDFFAVCVK